LEQARGYSQAFCCGLYQYQESEFGINPDNVFQGLGWWSFFIMECRWINHQFGYSFDNFDELLVVQKMDDHFKTADFDQNMPVVLAY
jgi:glucose-6-phosphate isomerase